MAIFISSSTVPSLKDLFIKIAMGRNICSASNLNRWGLRLSCPKLFLRLRRLHYLFNFVCISGIHKHTSGCFAGFFLISGELVFGSRDCISIVRTNICEGIIKCIRNFIRIMS